MTDIPGNHMSLTPEFGDEERLRQQTEYLEEQSEDVLPSDLDDAPDREVAELEREDREPAFLDAEANEAHAPGQVCARCGAVITEGQDARLRPDGRWMHEVCPPRPSETPAD